MQSQSAFMPPRPASASDLPIIAIPAFDLPLAAQAIARLRQEAAAEVERLLTLLDFLDGDPDLEPSYCGMTVGGGAQTAIEDECEDVSEDEGAQCDDEGAEGDVA